MFLDIFLGVAGFILAAAGIYLAVQANKLSSHSYDLSLNQSRDHSQIDTLTAIANNSGLQLKELRDIALNNSASVSKMNHLIQSNTDALNELERINQNTSGTTASLISAILQLKTINENTRRSSDTLRTAIMELKQQNKSLELVNAGLLTQLSESQAQTLKIDSQLQISNYQNEARMMLEANTLVASLDKFHRLRARLPEKFEKKRDLARARPILGSLWTLCRKMSGNYLFITHKDLQDQCNDIAVSLLGERDELREVVDVADLDETVVANLDNLSGSLEAFERSTNDALDEVIKLNQHPGVIIVCPRLGRQTTEPAVSLPSSQ